MVRSDDKVLPDRDPGAVIGAVITSGLGIAVAGGLFPILILVFATLYSLSQSAGGGPSLLDPTVYFGVVIYFFAGCIWAGFCGIISSILTVFFDLSFGIFLSPRRAVILNGGIAGFIATFPTMLVFTSKSGATAFLTLTPLAMLMGYIGAVTSIQLVSPSHFQSPTTRRNGFKFQVRDMLAATFWFASVFSIERLIGNFVFTIWIGTGVFLLFGLILVDKIWLRLWRNPAINAAKTRELAPAANDRWEREPGLRYPEDLDR